MTTASTVSTFIALLRTLSDIIMSSKTGDCGGSDQLHAEKIQCLFNCPLKALGQYISGIRLLNLNMAFTEQVNAEERKFKGGVTWILFFLPNLVPWIE